MTKVVVPFAGLIVIAAIVVVLMIMPMAASFSGAVQDVSRSVEYSAAVNLDELLAEDIRYLSVEHAVDRHGDALTWTIVENCQSNPLAKHTRAQDGRTAIGCEYEPGKYGVAIYDPDGELVTAFRNKARCLDELLKYFRNRGYLQ